MRERINRLAKGIIDMETPALTIWPERMEEEIPADEVTRKDFFVTSGNGLHIKGLVYSSNLRVRALTGSFGGFRNRITYEIDGNKLEYGDQIEGSFYLVTNGGEKEIPYSFRVQNSASGKTLDRLKKVSDFGDMAREDFDMAMRIFEYRDFTRVPFMQDLHIRAVYDSLIGHGDRYGQLEQFLIAMDQKEPVRLELEGSRSREYQALDGVVEDQVVIRKHGWGYLPITVRIEGNFIQTMKKTIAPEDFEDDICHFSYRISPDGLHGGRNFGRLIFESAYEQLVVEAEASSILAVRREEEKKHASGLDVLAGYFKLRLDYESLCGEKKGERRSLKCRMLEELDQVRLVYGPSMELSLAGAELYELTGRREEAMACLKECKEQVLEQRSRYPSYYCLFQYVLLKLQPDREREESLKRLISRYVEEGSADYLMFVLYGRCWEEVWEENPGEMLTRMKVLYSEGCRSPFLYQQALNLWNGSPQYLYGAGSFELQVLNYGIRKSAVSEELAVKAARLAAAGKREQELALRLLKQFYSQYPRTEILEAICSLMIRGDCRTKEDFVWYEKALGEQLSLTKLYEYFLYSLPEDYGKLLPKEVLLYFSYQTVLDEDTRAVLYANLVTYMDQEDPLYREYQKEISRFGTEQILKGRISRPLSRIYDAVIYEDMVDVAIAKVLPSILKSCRIETGEKRMRQVVVRYEELMEEHCFQMVDGVAYVPLYSGQSCILFQDEYGNRYGDISYTSTPVLNRPELEKRCFEVYPEHGMLLLEACREAAKRSFPDEKEILIMERTMMRLEIHPLYKGLLTGRIIDYCTRQAGSEKEEEPLRFLLDIDPELLNVDQRKELCDAMISRSYMKEAYGLLKRYYCKIEPENYLRICSRMILEQMYDQDDQLLNWGFLAFKKGYTDRVVLDYLCEHYNGTSRQMYQILAKAVGARVETYDMEERLLAQMMFSGKTDQIDRVFSLYMKRKKTSDLLVKAYFTLKSAQYFLYDVPADDEVFRYLESMVYRTAEKEKLSTIYLLALSRYYAGLERLDGERRTLCQKIVDILLADGMVFPYFKDLGRHVRIPEDIMDKAMIQYVGQKDSRVDLQIRILPQEKEFHGDSMKRVYQGIFVRQKVLFDGEKLEYRVYELKGEQKVLVTEGAVRGNRQVEEEKESRFHLLNEMSMCLNLKEEEGLKRAMESYVKKTAVIEHVFELI